MARQSARDIRIYWDEFKYDGYLNAFGAGITQGLPVTTAFSNDGPRVIPANYDYTVNFGGFSDYVDNDIDEQLQTDFGDNTDHYLAGCPLITSGIPTENTIGYEYVVQLASRPQSFAVGGAAGFSATAQGSAQATRATVLRSATVTGTGNGTGRNMGVTTSGQIFAVVFRVISGTFSAITIVVQESSDDAAADAYVAIAGLTSGSLSAAGVVRVTTTAATEAWKRVSVTAFTGTDAVILVTAGVVAGI